MTPLEITSAVVLPAHDLEVRFSRASGPGGQHVNTTDTRVRLHFNLAGTEALSRAVKDRVRAAYGNRINKQGWLVLTCDTHRSRGRNLELARERLAGLIRPLLRAPKKRRATRPSKGAVKRRLDAKKRRSSVKSSRRRVRHDD